jgi:hypothetical protein
MLGAGFETGSSCIESEASETFLLAPIACGRIAIDGGLPGPHSTHTQ